ncbi:MAG: hypothetical protein MUP49_06900 [Dehalococcoidia bacterium]|nr:hypothetical protein [Dehalococcoidia bacterium]
MNWIVPELALGQSLRLSLLFVDKIVAECDSEDLPERALASLTKEGKLTKKALRKLSDIIVPIKLIVPQFGMKDLLRKPQDEFLDFVAEYYIDKEYLSLGKDPPSESRRIFYDTRYRATAAAFENWFALSKQISSLFIPNYFEEPILQDFLRYLRVYNDPRTKRDYYKFIGVLTKMLPSVEGLSFDEVLELRRHEYFASFRAKTAKIVDRVLSISNVTETKRVIKEEELKDIRILEDLFRPRPILKLLRVLIGSLPIPVIPLNPVGVYDAIDTIRKERKAAKEVGWLYFVRDLKESDL